MYKLLKKAGRLAVAGLAVVVLALPVGPGLAARPLRVDTTLPDLASLAREVGGDQVAVTSFAKGTEDPHFVEAKPSFIKELSGADLFIENGLELELGWVPPLQQNARNGRVLRGAAGYLDASRAITAVQMPRGTIDRSMGDVHPGGNPHYLLDPLNGLRVARLIRDKLTELRPEAGPYFSARYSAFARRVNEALVGDKLAKKYDATKLALLYQRGKLAPFLKQQGDAAALGGWLGAMLPHYGAKAVDDHDLWPYFARTFGVRVVGHMEPKPGVSPTTSHLGEVVGMMRAQGVKIVMASAYYDPRHARFVAEKTGAKVANLANLVGARPGTGDYLAMMDYNVRQLAVALGGS